MTPLSTQLHLQPRLRRGRGHGAAAPRTPLRISAAGTLTKKFRTFLHVFGRFERFCAFWSFLGHFRRIFEHFRAFSDL